MEIESMTRTDQKRYSENMNSGGSYLFIKEGQQERLRFFGTAEDNDPAYLRCYVHDFGVENKYKMLYCRDQKLANKSCPMCQAGVKRKFQAFTPVYAYSKKKFMVYPHGVKVADDISNRIAIKPLKGRDWFLMRTGKGNTTQYSLESSDPCAFSEPVKKEDLSKTWADFKKFIIGTDEELKNLLASVPKQPQQQEHKLPTEASETGDPSYYDGDINL